MRLRIVTVADPGVPNQERLHLSVLVDAQLEYYVVLRSFTVPGQAFALVSAGTAPAFWFPSRPVKAGDNVVLYTGSGMMTSNVRPDGGTDHFFYWGMPQTLFHDPNACVVLTELNWWQSGR